MNMPKKGGQDAVVDWNCEKEHVDVPQHYHKKHDELVCVLFGNFGQTEPVTKNESEEKGE